MWVFYAALATAAPDVLMVGNSYTYYNDLEVLLADQLNELVPEPRGTGDRLTNGGWNLRDHALEYGTGTGRWPAAIDAATGVVVLQDQSQIPGFGEKNDDYIRSRNGAFGLNEAITNAGAETMLFITWGRRDGDAGNPSLYPDFETMQARLDEGYLGYAALLDEPSRPVYLAPVGRVFGAIRAQEAEPDKTGSVFRSLYVADGSHPSLFGSQVAAMTLAATITGQVPIAPNDAPIEGLGQLVYDTVYASGVDDLQLPWVFTWNRYSLAFDLTEISHPWRPLEVRVQRPAMSSHLTVGALHDGVMGSGRLSILEEAALLLDESLTVGVDAPGVVSVSPTGGLLADEVTLGPLATLTMDNASLDLGILRLDEASDVSLRGTSVVGLRLLEGDLALEGGSLSLPTVPVQLNGDVSIDGGSLVWGGGTVDVAGELTVDGPIVTTQDLLDGTTLIVADSLTASSIPEGTELVIDADGRDVLQTISTGGNIVDPTSEKGCQAVSGPIGAGWWASLGLLWWGRRRRSEMGANVP